MGFSYLAHMAAVHAGLFAHPFLRLPLLFGEAHSFVLRPVFLLALFRAVALGLTATALGAARLVTGSASFHDREIQVRARVVKKEVVVVEEVVVEEVVVEEVVVTVEVVSGSS
jgi:hypothetical protein